MAGRLWKFKNALCFAVYQAQSQSFKGEVPKITEDRASWEELLKFLLCNVVEHCYDPQERAFRLPFGPQVSWQGVRSDVSELQLRTFIGASYLVRHASCPDLEKVYLDVIRQGVDPKSKFCWGRIPGYQMLVENLTLLTGVLLNPDKFWNPLSKTERGHFLDYVDVCSHRKFVDNNWLWSKVFHLLFIQKFGENNDRSLPIRDVLKRIDSFYSGDGWYRDGLDEGEYRYDHYNSWVMHYYGLLFCSLAGAEFDDVKAVLRLRFIDFKKSYSLIFSNDRLPVAWGRSLIYRFGMLSCFGVALEQKLLSGEDQKDLKAFSVETINRFFRAGILDKDGSLTMGYSQTNKNVIEGYSGAGSPYWALKGFSFLLADPQSDFWKAPASKRIPADRTVHVGSCGFSIQSQPDGHNLVVNAGIASRLYSEKYNRFAFSNAFPLSFDKRCRDNALMIIEGSRSEVLDIRQELKNIQDGVMLAKWRSSRFPDIALRALTVVVPHGYVVVLRVEVKKRYKFRFGGFCDVSDGGSLLRAYKVKGGHYGEQRISPESNILGKTGRIPYFESFFEIGTNELVFCALASVSEKLSEPIYQEQDGRITIKVQRFTTTFTKPAL